MSGGLFIPLEGVNGSGKTSQVERLRGRLQRRGSIVTTVREPGSTQLGKRLRTLIKASPTPLTSEAELLLFNASRAQLVSEVIRPALERGEVVISDRFSDSTTAYQGYGRGIPLDQVEAVNRIGTGTLKPDLTILLDLHPEEGLKRGSRTVDRFEVSEIMDFHRRDGQGYLFEALHEQKKGSHIGQEESQGELFQGGYEQAEVADFNNRVRQGYLELAHREPERWLTIDARLPRREISELIWQRVEPMLPISRRARS